MIKVFLIIASLTGHLAQGLGKYRQINEDLIQSQPEVIDSIKQERFLRGSETNSDSR